MADEGPMARARGNVTEIVAMLVTGIWLAALFLDVEWWLAFMLFGYVVLVPLTELLFGEDDETDAATDTDFERHDRHTVDDSGETDAALDTLRERYARGELTEEQFERKVERLLETDTLENVEDRHRERDRYRERETE